MQHQLKIKIDDEEKNKKANITSPPPSLLSKPNINLSFYIPLPPPPTTKRHRGHEERGVVTNQ